MTNFTALDRTSSAVVLGTLPVLVKALFRSHNRARSYGLEVLISFARRLMSRLSIAQLQFLNPSTSDTYSSWVRKHHYEALTEDLGKENAKLHWLGDKSTASKILLYFHGSSFPSSAVW